MTTGAQMLLGILAGCALAGGAAADDLLRDPFRPPADLVEALAAGQGAPDISSGRSGLRGILVSGGKALVNFGGHVLAVGEAANGHQLLEAGEDFAVFQHGEDVITLTLNEDRSNEAKDR